MRINRTGNLYKVYDNNNMAKKEITKFNKEDRLVLSNEALEYQHALKGLYNTPELRKEKVAALKAEVQSGNYIVDSEKIADKMLGKAKLIKQLNSW